MFCVLFMLVTFVVGKVSHNASPYRGARCVTPQITVAMKTVVSAFSSICGRVSRLEAYGAKWNFLSALV